MQTMGILSPLTPLLAQTKSIDLLVFLLDTIILERPLFCATILFDGTRAYFTWLFESFLARHNGNHPRTVFTDQDIAMGNDVAEVFTVAWHG
jgi:zinc finger SWIM domain-containing protein 3